MRHMARNRLDHADADRLERELVGVVMQQLARSSGLRRIGESKRCSVCGLEGARNSATLGRAHSQEEHQRERLKPAAARKRNSATAVAAKATTPAAPAPALVSVRDQLRVVG